MDLDIAKLIEKATRQREIRAAALRNTLKEIELLEAAGIPRPEALAQVRTRRDRQHKALQASDQLIDALKGSQTAKKAK